MLELLWSSRAWMQYAILAFLFVLALRRGAAPERLCAGILFAMVPASLLGTTFFKAASHYNHLNYSDLLADVVAFIGLTWVALRANRVYPLWLGGAQMIALTGHLARITSLHVDGTAYAIMGRMPLYIEIVAMSLGMAFHMRRTRTIGNYPSWRKSSPPLPAGGRTA